MHLRGIRQSPAMRIMFLTIGWGVPGELSRILMWSSPVACTQTNGPTVVLLATQLPSTRANTGQRPRSACSLPFSPDEVSLLFLESGGEVTAELPGAFSWQGTGACPCVWFGVPVCSPAFVHDYVGFYEGGALLAASQRRMSESHTTCVLSDRLASFNHLNGVPLEEVLE